MSNDYEPSPSVAYPKDAHTYIRPLLTPTLARGAQREIYVNLLSIVHGFRTGLITSTDVLLTGLFKNGLGVKNGIHGFA